MVRLSLAEKNIEENGVPETRKVLKLVKDHIELNLVKASDASKVEDLQYLRPEDVKLQLQKLNKNGSEPKIKNIFANTNRL